MSKTQERFKERFRPFDDSKKKTKKISGREITFVEWTQYIIRGYGDFPEGFSTRVVSVSTIGSVWQHAETGEVHDDRQLALVVEVEDMETGIVHQATGFAPVGKTKEVYGGAFPEAESQALRRAFAKHGLGLEMYLDEDEVAEVEADMAPPPDPEKQPTPDQITRMKELVAICQEHDLNAWIDQAREKVLEAGDRRKMTGIVIRKLKDALEAKGLYQEEGPKAETEPEQEEEAGPFE